MSKQDRAYVRTAAQLEQKYLGRLSAQGIADSSELATQVRNLSQTVASLVTETNTKLKELETQGQQLSQTLAEYMSSTDEKIEELVLATKESYNVTFYSENRVVIASYIIKQGDAINPPIDDVNWVDGNGTKVTFPYAPTSDVELHIHNFTLADTIYDAYGVSKNEYPYLLIYADTFTYKCFLRFATDISITDSTIVMQGNTLSGSGGGSSSLPFDQTDVNAMAQYIINRNLTLTEGTTALNNKKDSSKTFYINFDKGDFTGKVYNI